MIVFHFWLDLLPQLFGLKMFYITYELMLNDYFLFLVSLCPQFLGLQMFYILICTYVLLHLYNKILHVVNSYAYEMIIFHFCYWFYYMVSYFGVFY